MKFEHLLNNEKGSKLNETIHTNKPHLVNLENMLSELEVKSLLNLKKQIDLSDNEKKEAFLSASSYNNLLSDEDMVTLKKEQRETENNSERYRLIFYGLGLSVGQDNYLEKGLQIGGNTIESKSAIQVNELHFNPYSNNNRIATSNLNLRSAILLAGIVDLNNFYNSHSYKNLREVNNHMFSSVTNKEMAKVVESLGFKSLNLSTEIENNETIQEYESRIDLYMKMSLSFIEKLKVKIGEKSLTDFFNDIYYVDDFNEIEYINEGRYYYFQIKKTIRELIISDSSMTEIIKGLFSLYLKNKNENKNHLSFNEIVLRIILNDYKGLFSIEHNSDGKDYFVTGMMQQVKDNLEKINLKKVSAKDGSVKFLTNILRERITTKFELPK